MSHILTSIAIRACQAGLTVRFARCADVLADVLADLADGSYERRLRRFCGIDFLVRDDVGLGQGEPGGSAKSQQVGQLLTSIKGLPGLGCQGSPPRPAPSSPSVAASVTPPAPAAAAAEVRRPRDEIDARLNELTPAGSWLGPKA